MSDIVPILYLVIGAAIAFAGVLGFMDPDKIWRFEASRTVKRVISGGAVFLGMINMAQGFAHY